VGTVLAAGGMQPFDPGAGACVRAIERALPEWQVVRPPRKRGLSSWISAAERADAIVFAGTTLFNGRPPHSTIADPTRAAGLALYTRVRNKPLAMIGLGAARPSTLKERSIAREIVRSSDLLVLRDSDSAMALGAAGAPPPFRIGSDAAWAAFDHPLSAPRSSNAVLMVVASNGDRDAHVRSLHAASNPLVAEGTALHLQPWTESDVVLARAVAARLGFGARVFDPITDLVAFQALCSGHRVVVGGNVHALVAAGAAGVPFVAIGGEPGAVGIATRLAQSSLEADAPSRKLTALVRDAADRGGPPESAVEAEIAGARETLRLLRVLLSGGRTGDADAVSGLTLEPVPWR
jgi:polysaccharide pyruvyl transferase WcaK-like protein